MRELRPSPAAVGAVISQTLEEAAFLITEPITDQLPSWPSRSLLQARLSLSGSKVSGTLFLICSARLAVEMAANMMGIEPSEEQAAGAAMDALGEVLNMVAGALCEQLFDEQAVEVGIPQVEVTTGELAKSSAEQLTVVSLQSDDGDWLLAAVRLDG